jgi:hypothetical protein
MDRQDSCDSSLGLGSHVAAGRRSPTFSVSRRFDRDTVLGGRNGDQHSNLRHASRGGGLQFGEHPIEAPTKGAKNEDTCRLIARVAESMTPAAGGFSIAPEPSDATVLRVRKSLVPV